MTMSSNTKSHPAGKLQDEFTQSCHYLGMKLLAEEIARVTAAIAAGTETDCRHVGLVACLLSSHRIASAWAACRVGQADHLSPSSSIAR